MFLVDLIGLQPEQTWKKLTFVCNPIFQIKKTKILSVQLGNTLGLTKELIEETKESTQVQK